MIAPTNRVTAALRAVLPPSARVGAPHERGRDVEVDVSGILLRARWVARGLPGEVKDALAEKPLPDLIVAPSMSPGARDVCANAGVSWLDEDGGAEVSKGLLVVSRTADPLPPRAVKRGWTPATFSVCEALLTCTPATVSATAKVTGLSAKTTTHALRFLEDLALLDSQAQRGPKSARRITDVRGLLDEYAKAVAQSRDDVPSMQVGVLWRDEISEATALGQQWDKANRQWAATGALAAAVIAPFATSITPLVILVDARTTAELRVAANDVQLKPIEKGRLTLRGFQSPATARLSSPVDDMLVCAPWPRVYADVRPTGVRGEDVAENLFEQMERRGRVPK